MIRVLVVAAYAAVRAGLHALLAEAEGCEVIGAVSGSAELEPLLPEARPDVVVFDENESDHTRVFEALNGSETGLVVLGESGSGHRALAGSSLPGWAYLLKDASGNEIAAAVQAVAAGLVVLDRGLAPSLIAPRPAGAVTGSETLPPGETLTARELEVLHQMARGLQNRQIASRLHISPHTVKFHVASILAKLGATSRTEAVALGARRGYVTL